MAKRTIAICTVLLAACPQEDPPVSEGGSSGETGDATSSTSGPASTSSAGSGSTEDGLDSTTAASPIECDLFTNDCPAGTKCMAYAEESGGTWVGTACMPLDDAPAALGEPCEVQDHPSSGLDNCDAQAICWFVDPTSLAGECVGMCTSDNVDPGCDLPCDTLCTIATELAPPLCLAGCDPLMQDCAAGRSCVAADTHFVCVVDESGDAGAMGDPCESLGDCDPGLFCLSNLAWPDCEGPGGCCAPACDVDDPDACDGAPRGVACQSWYGPGMGPPDNACTPFQQIGVCGI
ncbi:MAG: hypothetical protein AAF721_30835 [Myxococcota bacterium]